VTTVFNRLVGYAEVRSFHNQKGRRVWQWIAEPEPGLTADIAPLIAQKAEPQAIDSIRH